ncbi:MULTISPECIES: helix-turn-helix transcriptional regulator [unclassified Pseudomonas]|uniref:AraC family transcriptional regulator n=1 Tax=unclassified Pseudomonas TaxID=196821 RepID=UPI002AC897FE|nr:MULTISPECIES: helix-turn-helix transcriptional regulator [unclassified Pseudomonas]MEB0046477.1 helix-turn-helix transcriptional regulator [Pseudomonas sp. Dout3]MEB0097903.1 helix-turn-helix transcriptional regulator [Pseudomonas sp. DC1.2]WPX59531.1 helix-turn-helix transcriptional regulator [Pseudomonas sp. DC1.2]
MNSKHIDLLDFTELPAPVYFRYADFDTHEYASAHRHPWGSLEYSARGVLHMDIGGSRFRSPPQYAVWVPPQTEHSFYSNQPINYRAVCLAPPLCIDLPQQACTLAISEIVKAILKDFAARDVKIAQHDADQRLAHVLVDQLQQAPVLECYLPYASSPGLLAILEAMQAEPGDNRPLAQWAEQIHVSERTLARQFVRELGMSFGEWRQRLRFLAAIEALESPRSIQEIAFDMGYSASSAFIAMFQRQAGCTPEHYRRYKTL